ncbi:MAG: beta-propeller fold lactonase family protein [Parvularculaceae bacterium]
MPEIRLGRREFIAGIGALGVTGCNLIPGSRPHRHRVFIGTFTNASGEVIPRDFGARHSDAISRGLYCFEFDAREGEVGPVTLAAEISNPTNLIPHPSGRILYACRGQNTRINGRNPVTALRLKDDGSCAVINTEPVGQGPTVGCVDRAGRTLLTTNFSSHSVVAMRLNRDGAIGARTAYITNVADDEEIPSYGPPSSEPHDPDYVFTKPHDIKLSPDEHFAVVPEIRGNRCSVYKFDSFAGSLTPHSVADAPAHTGPRHIGFHPSGRWLYSSGEAGSFISAWNWSASEGILTHQQRLSALPDGWDGRNNPADCVVHPSGRFVYVTNRGCGTIAVFAVNDLTGELSLSDQSEIGSPSCWGMAFDPSGSWAIITAQIADEVRIYAVSPDTGALTYTGRSVPIVLPTCAVIV